jgi:hypothetical protein
MLKNINDFMNYWGIIKYPFSVWLLYLIIFSFIAIIGATSIAYLFMLGSGSMTLAILFGFWTGLRASKLGGRLVHAPLSAFVLALAIGFFSLLFELGIAMLSHSFFSIFAYSILQLLLASISSWVLLIMLSALGAAIGNELRVMK